MKQLNQFPIMEVTRVHYVMIRFTAMSLSIYDTLPHPADEIDERRQLMSKTTEWIDTFIVGNNYELDWGGYAWHSFAITVHPDLASLVIDNIQKALKDK